MSPAAGRGLPAPRVARGQGPPRAPGPALRPAMHSQG